MLSFKIFLIITITRCALANSEENETPVDIPEGYVITKGIGAHKFHTDKKTWNQARKSCIKEGAHLAVINSQDEDLVIQKTVNSHNAEQTWIGYHELFENDDWVTVNDEQLNDIGYADWAGLQPDHKNGDEHCMSYTSRDVLNHGLNDFNCNEPNPYICEIHLQKKGH